MFNTTFNHGTIRKTVVAFGNLFNGLKIQRFNPNGSVLQEIDVPLAYSAREKWVTRISGNPDLLKSTSITLPRMAFEVLSYKYDPTRKLNSNNKVINCGTGNRGTSVFAPVPYNIEFGLYLASKTIEDSLAMLEQILPYFSPHYNLTVNTITELNLSEDIPIVLNGTNSDDNYLSEWIEERLLINTLNFTAKVNLFGPIATGQSVIKEVDVNFLTNAVGNTSSGENYNAIVNPRTAAKNEPHTIDETWSSI